MLTILSRPIVVAGLVAIFLIAGLIGGPANGVEVIIMEWFAAARAAWPLLAVVAGALTNIGGAYVTLGVTTLAAVGLLIRRAPARAIVLALTVLFERSAVEALKVLFGRPRPEFGVEWLPHSLAFPSGHSANSMTAFLALALIAAPPALRRTAVVSAIALSVMVGLTRLCLGVHWPSDVIGGWAFGLLAVAAALAIGRRSALLGFEPQHEVVAGHRPALDEDEAA